jgi:lipoprotein-releasing system permease protein
MLSFFKITKIFLLKGQTNRLNFATIISCLGMAIGIAALLIVVSVFESFQNELKRLVYRANPDLVLYSPYGIPNAPAVLEKLKSTLVSPVKDIRPFIYFETWAVHEDTTAVIYVKSLEKGFKEDFEKLVTPSSALAQLGPGEIILGSELARDLKVKSGQEVSLAYLVPEEQESSSQKAPAVQFKNFKVIGILSLGLSQYDSHFAFVNFKEAQSVLHQKFLTGFEMDLVHKDDALKEAATLRKQFPYYVLPWQELDSQLFYQIQRDGMSIQFIVLIISLVASFNIAMTLGITSYDRSREIALLRALGARKKFILGVFLSYGLIVGVIGSLLGFLLAITGLELLTFLTLGELKSFYFLEHVPIHYDLTLFLGAFLISLILSSLSTLVPAFKAVRIYPSFWLKRE